MDHVKLLRTYRYEIIAAVGGATVMILELVGARMIAPYFGTSIYVWTAMIGVILGALSLGYWYGGILADRRADDRGLMKILVIAAGAIWVCAVLQESLLKSTADLSVDIRIATLLSAALLFAPAATLLGVVSPYVAKLRLSSLKTAGQSIGRLYAAGTVGSIIGTFLAGYWLISWVGNAALAFSLVLILVLLSFAASYSGWLATRIVLAVLAMMGMLLPVALPHEVIADIDSIYSRYLVKEIGERQPLRTLAVDPFSTQSAQLVDDPDTLVFEYTKRFMTVSKNHPWQEMLVVGGGAFTFPLAAARAYPDREVSVVEIDPKLTDIAKEYFGLEDRSNLHIYHDDGRVFFNKSVPSKYDLIFLDAFSSLTPPYQLSTLEATQATKHSLRDRGVVVANVIASPRDPYGEAVMATYQSVFTYVDFYPVYPTLDADARQNIVVVMTDERSARDSARRSLGVVPVEVKRGVVLTDDFAPVEQLINQ